MISCSFVSCLMIFFFWKKTFDLWRAHCRKIRNDILRLLFHRKMHYSFGFGKKWTAKFIKSRSLELSLLLSIYTTKNLCLIWSHIKKDINCLNKENRSLSFPTVFHYSLSSYKLNNITNKWYFILCTLQSVPVLNFITFYSWGSMGAFWAINTI